MEVGSMSVQGNSLLVGTLHGRPVLIQTGSPGGQVLQLETGPDGGSDGRLHAGLEREMGYAFPPFSFLKDHPLVCTTEKALHRDLKFGIQF